jgi:hypothetical protein
VLHTDAGETVAVVPVDAALAEHGLTRGASSRSTSRAASCRRSARVLVEGVPPTVFAEFYPRGLEMAGTTPEEMWQELESWGAVGQFDPSGWFRPIDLTAAVEDPAGAGGFVDLVIQPRR